jgi:hypothetical protein
LNPVRVDNRLCHSTLLNEKQKNEAPLWVKNKETKEEEKRNWG